LGSVCPSSLLELLEVVRLSLSRVELRIIIMGWNEVVLSQLVHHLV